MKNLPPVIRASGAYYLANALLIVAGLISLPVMTRLLSKTEYGLLGLIYATVSALSIITNLGFGEALVRLHSEHKARGPDALRDLCGSLLGGSIAAAGVVAFALAAVAILIGNDTTSAYVSCLPLASLLLFVRAVSGVVYQIYRAEERAVAYAATQVLVRYGGLVVAISLLLLLRRDAAMVVVAAVTVEAVSLLARVLDLRWKGTLSTPRLTPSILKAAAAYGVPLAVASSAHYLLSYTDRFMIERLLDLDAVATYTVPYEIALKVGEMLSAPIQLAAVPIIFRLWATEGRDAASRFTSDVLSYVIAILVPIATLYLIYNEAIIVILASTKYSGAGQLTPYILPGVLFGSLHFVVATGLTVQKRTTVLAVLVCSATLLNFVLNLLLIPAFGLTGAAIATTAAYAALLAATYVASRSAMELRLHHPTLLRAAAATIPSVFVAHSVAMLAPTSPLGLAAGLVLGTIAAAVIFVALDGRLRQVILVQLGRQRG